jgi:AraC family transcriptional regulator, ethanolamine operon transcriptional activator
MTNAREPTCSMISTLAPLVDFKLITNDVDDLVRLYPGWKGQFQQVSAGRFHGTVQVVQGLDVRVFRGTTDQVLLTRGASQPGWIDFSPITTRNQRCRWQGRQCDENHVVVRGADVGVDNLASRGAEIITVSVRVDLLRKAAANALRFDGDPARINWQCHRVDPTELAALKQLVERITERSALDTNELETCDVCAIEQEFVMAALNVIGSRNEAGADKRRGNRAAIIRRGEEYLREHLAFPVGLIDMCEELGVSARTIQYAFRERFGIGPIEYLRMLRLNAVKSDLKMASNQKLTVRDVAVNWGYRHLGNFAADYKRHFGVLPSKARSGSIGQ